MSTITTGKVVIYKPNFSVNQVDTLLDLPVLGAENTLYVIKDTGAIYLWNGSEFITTTTPTSKTVYVDDTYGNDDTGMREFVNLPFKTIDAAVTVLQSGDKLVIGEGDYTWSNSLPVVSDISVEAKGNITKTNAVINNSVDVINKKVTFKADDLTANNTLGTFRNAIIDYDIKNLTMSSWWTIYPGTKGNINITDLTKTGTSQLFYIQGFDDYLNINIDNYYVSNVGILNYDRGILNYEQSNTIDALDKAGASITLNINNYRADAHLGGFLTIFDITGKAVSDQNYTINVKNTVQRGSDPNVIENYIGLMFADQANTNYTNNNFVFNLNNVDIDYPLLFKRRSIAGSSVVFNVDNLKINEESILRSSASGAANPIVNSTVVFNIKKGIVYTVFSYTNVITSILVNNSTIIIDGDITTNTDVVPYVTLDSTSKLIFRGRFNLGDKKFDLSNVIGAGADNVYFDDCTIITTGTNSIDAGSAKNIKVMNTYSNKVVSANITSFIEPIVVDAIIN